MTTETIHARARRAALIGLIVQTLSAIALFVLHQQSMTVALFELTWMTLGGVPIWFVLLLVFRQHELAALEQIDLEALRREKTAGGGGEALFTDEGGGPGFLLAKARLEWMQRWLVPLFGVLTSLYLFGMAWVGLGAIAFWPHSRDWPAPQNLDFALILLTLVMILLIFFSRYASGLARVREWQLLRAGGSFTFGCGLAALAIVAALAAQLAKLHDGVAVIEHYIAYAIPMLMILLGAETLLNFLLDFYRPRSPGQEPRAAFDSRLLGLVAEPGGIAHSLAEAMNYQFGFQVSQTWFYQLLQRVAVPLVGVGALAIWLLTGVVFVQSSELAIVERFGRPLNAQSPLGPGLHFKLPYPLDKLYKFNTGQLHEFVVGYKVAHTAAPPAHGVAPAIELWTDEQHGGGEHFNFIIAPPPPSAAAATSRPAAPFTEGRTSPQATAVNMVRAHSVVQYRIRAEQLADYVATMHEDYHDAPQVDRYLQEIAWNEMVRLLATVHIDKIMGDYREAASALLKQRIAARLDALKLGIEIVHVGFLGIHPEKTVSESFRTVVTAQQQRTAEIRKARVEENSILSRVAGDRERALALAQAVQAIGELEAGRGDIERALRGGKPISDEAWKQLEALRPQFDAQTAARWELDQAGRELSLAQHDFELGLGATVRDVRVRTAARESAQKAADAAIAALEQGLASQRAALTQAYGAAVAEAAIATVENRFRMSFWQARLERYLVGLEGDAAVRLAQAQAQRWGKELKAASELTSVQAQRFAYAANPVVYRARRYFQVLTSGLKDARKYVVGFDPGERPIKFLIEGAEQARQGLEDMPTRERN